MAARPRCKVGTHITRWHKVNTDRWSRWLDANCYVATALEFPVGGAQNVSRLYWASLPVRRSSVIEHEAKSSNPFSRDAFSRSDPKRKAAHVERLLPPVY